MVRLTLGALLSGITLAIWFVRGSWDFLVDVDSELVVVLSCWASISMHLQSQKHVCTREHIWNKNYLKQVC
jgi:hypothetical protein